MTLLNSVAPLLPLVLATGVAPKADEPMFVWIVGFAGVLVIVNQALTFWRSISGGMQRKPDAPGYTSADLCHEKHASIDAKIAAQEEQHKSLMEQVRTDFEKIQRSGEARASGIHNRINEVLAMVSELRGKQEVHHG